MCCSDGIGRITGPMAWYHEDQKRLLPKSRTQQRSMASPEALAEMSDSSGRVMQHGNALEPAVSVPAAQPNAVDLLVEWQLAARDGSNPRIGMTHLLACSYKVRKFPRR